MQVPCWALALTVGTCYGTFLLPLEMAPGGVTGNANSGTHQFL